MADDLIVQGYAPYADTRQPWLRSPPCVLFAQSVERHESSAEVPAKLEVHLKKPVPWTNWVPWIFAAKTTASGLIALLVAFTGLYPVHNPRAFPHQAVALAVRPLGVLFGNRWHARHAAMTSFATQPP